MRVENLFEILISIILNIYSEVGLLDHMVVLILISGGNFILFFIVAEPFSIPTNSVSRVFSLPLPTLLIIAHAMLRHSVMSDSVTPQTVAHQATLSMGTLQART